MKLVPIPHDALDRTRAVWWPFLEKIAARSRAPIAQLHDDIRCGKILLHILFDEVKQEAAALAGSQVCKYGDQLVAEFVWCTGSGKEHWLPLFPELEQYHREHLGCTAFKAICRPGWSRFLKQHGYRMTHVVMEKDF